ncbi:P-loop containing nucleoside triphosphate hydrolase protein [Xylaria palmicola]|nr:P-loop containing nucleoside triphosphate hydrolase protein [Xylaria palmicola]
MSDDPAPLNSFEAIGARNVLAGNNFSGPTTISFDASRDGSQSCPQATYRSIPFPRNDDLVPRGAVMAKLNERLPGKPGYRAAALWGLGGSGKTQIALEYAYDRMRDPHCSVFWVHADSSASFTQDYHSIARKLSLGSDLAGKSLLQAVRDKLETNPNWVLVLDEADDLKLFGLDQQEQSGSSDPTLNLNAFIPKISTAAGNGTVLWTSRDRQIAGSLVLPQQAIEVVKMTSEEASKLLATFRGKETEESETTSAGQLLDELDYLPLAISQAATYMRRTGMLAGEYLAKIQKDTRVRWKMMSNAQYNQYRRHQELNSVLKTWDISVEYLRGENELIYDVLHTLAFVDNQNIPFELVREAVRLPSRCDNVDEECDAGEEYDTDEELDTNEDSTDEHDIGEIITRLCEFSFLSIRPSPSGGRETSYDMHKLVQEAARYRLQKDKSDTKNQAYFAKMAFWITNHLFPIPDPDTWKQCERYLTHAQQAWVWAEHYHGELAVANLLMRVSRYFAVKWRGREGEAVVKKALGFRREMLGDRHPSTLEATYSLSTMYAIQGMLVEAENTLLRANQISKEVLAPDNPVTLHEINAIAYFFKFYGRPKTAEEMLRHVLESKQNVLDREHPAILLCMSSLAENLAAQGKGEEAESLHRQVLQQRAQTLGEKHPETLMSMLGLARIIGDRGKYKEAEYALLELLEVQKEVSGMKHFSTIDILSALGWMSLQQRNYKKAEDMYRASLAILEETLGEKYHGTLECMGDIARMLCCQGNFEEAERIFRKLLPLFAEVQGTMHPGTLRNINDLGLALCCQGNFEEAERISRKLLPLFAEVQGTMHPYTLRNMNNLGTALRCQEKHKEAEDMHRQALQLSTEALGAKHPVTLNAMLQFGATLKAQRKYEEAEAVLGRNVGTVYGHAR